MERFWNKVNKTEDCWTFEASGNKWGYGQFWYMGKYIGAHRFSYMLEHGELPEGKDIHHICRNRRCVRPEHLEALTREEHNKKYRNLAPAIAATIKKYAERTECSNGHMLTEENTRVYINSKGYRERRCRTCHREREARTRKERDYHRR